MRVKIKEEKKLKKKLNFLFFYYIFVVPNHSKKCGDGGTGRHDGLVLLKIRAGSIREKSLISKV